jgi:hypothetical protein
MGPACPADAPALGATGEEAAGAAADWSVMGADKGGGGVEAACTGGAGFVNDCANA